jgi:hypothetical protein
VDSAAPPAVIAPAPAMRAADQLGPRDARERAACARASTVDVPYLLVAGALAVGGIAADVPLRSADEGVRLLGPAALGLGWGFALGSIYPSLPKCGATWLASAPPEGTQRSSTLFAVSMALVAGVTAPLVLGIEQGFTFPESWSVPERQGRLVIAGLSAFGGALIPYLVPPRPWAAWRELQSLRVGATPDGATVGYAVRF